MNFSHRTASWVATNAVCFRINDYSCFAGQHMKLQTSVLFDSGHVSAFFEQLNKQQDEHLQRNNSLNLLISLNLTRAACIHWCALHLMQSLLIQCLLYSSHRAKVSSSMACTSFTLYLKYFSGDLVKSTPLYASRNSCNTRCMQHLTFTTIFESTLALQKLNVGVTGTAMLAASRCRWDPCSWCRFVTVFNTS